MLVTHCLLYVMMPVHGACGSPVGICSYLFTVHDMVITYFMACFSFLLLVFVHASVVAVCCGNFLTVFCLCFLRGGDPNLIL